MDSDRQQWMERYRTHEAHCVKAAMLPEGKRRDAAYSKLRDELEELQNDPAAVKQAIVTDVENAWAELVAKYIIHEETNRYWLAWIGNPIGDPPPTDCQELAKAVAVWEWTNRFAQDDKFKPSSELVLEYEIHKPDGDKVQPHKGTFDKALKGLPEEHRKLAGNTWIYRPNAVRTYLAENKPSWRYIG